MGITRIKSDFQPQIDQLQNMCDQKIGDLSQLNPLYFPNDNIVSAINAVPNMMSKTFYVDAVNGDDNNDGSASAPFRTIKKAVDSVPIGGYVRIYVKGSEDENNPLLYEIDTLIFNKIVEILPYPETYSIFRPYVVESSSYNIARGFILYNSSLFVQIRNQIRLESAPKKSETKPWLWYFAGLINMQGGHCNFTARGYPIGIGVICREGESSIVHLCNRDTFQTSASISISFTKIQQTRANQANKTFNIYSSSGVLDIASYQVTAVDESLSGISFSDTVSGIVRDSNGTPRNIISNLVL